MTLPHMRSSRLKSKHPSRRLGARGGLLLLLIPPLAPNSGKRFLQIGIHTFRVAKRRVKDGLHLGLHTGPMKGVTALRSVSAQEMFHPRSIRESSTAYREYLPSNLASIPSADKEL